MSTESFLINVVSVGPQKTGTTWLYENINSHPSLCFPKDVKETMFFDEYYHQSLDRYKSYFQHCQSKQLCCEVAPSYFDVPDVPRRIHEANPECKIIVHLRQPADRTFSLYCHHLRKGRVPDDFEAATQKMPRILASGHYGKHIPSWLDVFGPDNILFVLMDDLKRDPEAVLAEVCLFLDIPNRTNELNINAKVNKAGMPKFPVLAKAATKIVSVLRANQFDRVVELAKKLGLKRVYSGGEAKMPKMSHQERHFLNGYYEDDIQYVEKLLNRQLPEWRAL